MESIDKGRVFSSSSQENGEKACVNRFMKVFETRSYSSQRLVAKQALSRDFLHRFPLRLMSLW